MSTTAANKHVFCVCVYFVCVQRKKSLNLFFWPDLYKTHITSIQCPFLTKCGEMLAERLPFSQSITHSFETLFRFAFSLSLPLLCHSIKVICIPTHLPFDANFAMANLHQHHTHSTYGCCTVGNY